MMRRLALFGLAALLVAGCDKDEEVDPPAELVDVKPTIQVKELWSTRIGDAGEHLRLSLGIAVDGDTLYVASHKGVVQAISAVDGRTRWRAETKLALSAGPGGGNGLVALGTSDGDVVALEAADGRQRWKARVSGEVLSAPLVADDRVVGRRGSGKTDGEVAERRSPAGAVEVEDHAGLRAAEPAGDFRDERVPLRLAPPSERGADEVVSVQQIRHGGGSDGGLLAPSRMLDSEEENREGPAHALQVRGEEHEEADEDESGHPGHEEDEDGEHDGDQVLRE